MARFEQSTSGVAEGGGSTMTEAALNIIENYLSLVRKYLPDSIANDIIDEIRDYIIEAAEEEGGGALTEESAKRTVARFGAPSEVAAEYKASMLTDDDTIEIEDIREERSSTRVPSAPPRIKRPTSTGRPVSQLTAFLHFVAVASIWAVITSIPALTFAAVLIPTYVVISIGFGFSVMLYNKTNKNTSIERSFPDWPFIQRIASFPDGFLPVQNREAIQIEAILTAGAIVLLMLAPGWWLVIPLLVARYWVIDKRMKGIDPAQFVRIDAVLEVCTLLALNLGFGFLVFQSYYHYYYSVGWMFSPVAIILGAYVLVRLTAATPELWVERISIVDERTTPLTSEAPEEEHYDETTEDRSTGRAASYGSSLLKAAIVSVFWTALLSIALFAVANPIDVIVFVALFACLIQMPVLVGVQTLNIARAKIKGTILWNEENKTWSILRRAFTFPKGVFRDQARFMLFVDMLATLGSMFVIGYAFVILSIPLFVEAVMYAFIIIAGARLLFLHDRWTNGAARRHDLGEYLSTVVTLLVGNYLMIVILHGPYYLWIRYTASYYLVNGLYWPFWAIYGVYLLYSLVARGQTLWHDEGACPKVPEKKSVSSEKAPKSEEFASWGKLEARYHQALRHTLGWNVVIGLVALIIYLLGTTSASQLMPLILNQILIVLLVPFIMGGWVFTTFYFLWRKGIVDSGKSSTTVGRRGRFQSFIDVGLTGFALIWIIAEVNSQSSFIRGLTSGYVQYMGQLSIVQGQIGSIIVASAFISLVFAVPIVRLISDLACFLRNDSEFSNQAMLVSGVLFCLLVGLTLGMIPLTRNVSGSITPPPASGEVVTLFLVLLLGILIIWQTIISRIKLAESGVGTRVSSGEHVVEDLGYGEIDLPIN
jgi:hypothetical protein